MADRPASRPLTRGGPLPPGPRGCGPGDTHVFRRRRRRRFPSLWLGCPQAGRSAGKRIAIVEAGRQPLDRLRLVPGHLHRDRLGAGVCDQSLEALLSAVARVLDAAERKLDAAAGAARRGHAGTGRGRQARATTTLGRTRRDRPGTLLMDPLTSGGARARPGHGRAAFRLRPAPASAGASPCAAAPRSDAKKDAGSCEWLHWNLVPIDFCAGKDMLDLGWHASGGCRRRARAQSFGVARASDPPAGGQLRP
jgi:hypothetical protein